MDLCVRSGQTSLKQTPEFRLAVRTCLTKGHAQIEIAIALAIHDTAIAEGYPGECRGKGLNFEKINSTINNCKIALKQTHVN